MNYLVLGLIVGIILFILIGVTIYFIMKPSTPTFSKGDRVEMTWTAPLTATSLCVEDDDTRKMKAYGVVETTNGKIGVKWVRMFNVNTDLDNCCWVREGKNKEWIDLYMGSETTNPTYQGAPRSVFTDKEAKASLVKITALPTTCK